MKRLTFLAALLALSNWMFVTGGKAWAHGGTDLVGLQSAVLDCEDDDGDKDDSASTVLDCHDDDDDDNGDKS